MKDKKLKVRLFVILIIAITGITFVFWLNNSYKPTEEAKNALVSNEEVLIEIDDMIVFKPIEEIKGGLIFYPGGKVEPEAYSILAREIAKEGYLVAIVPMTFDLAIMSPNRADKVISRFTDVKTWVIGGHSLGGVMAASYASKNGVIDGLVLYAAYPQGEELKDLNIEVKSIYGSNDGVADLEKIKNATLTKNSELIEIVGGNHAGFGSYGSQKGDNEATITSEEQIEKAAQYTVELLDELIK